MHLASKKVTTTANGQQSTSCCFDSSKTTLLPTDRQGQAITLSFCLSVCLSADFMAKTRKKIRALTEFCFIFKNLEGYWYPTVSRLAPLERGSLCSSLRVFFLLCL